MVFSVPITQETRFLFYEASYDLLDNEFLTVKNRFSDMIPKPFVLNDAIIVKKSITIK